METVEYGRYANAINMSKRRNRAMTRAMHLIETAMLAVNHGDTGVASEKMLFAFDLLDAARRDGLEVFE